MKKWRIWSYDLKLFKPISALEENSNRRKGLIVGRIGTDGIWGYGEAAPINGLHEKDISAVFQEISGHLSNRNRLPFNTLSPISRCALEMTEMRFDRQEKIRTNGLIAADEVCGPKTNRFRGYQTVKIKVGGDPIEESKRVREIARTIGTGKSLRIDANQKWNIHQAERFLQGIRNCNLDYIEEPIHDIEHLELLKWPIALDESLLEIGIDECLSLPHLQAIILKPTLLGMKETLALQKQIKSVGAMPIISSTSETSIGLRALAATAARSKSAIAGLDTCRWFNEDLLEDRLIPDDDRLFNPGMVKTDEICFDRLDLKAEG